MCGCRNKGVKNVRGKGNTIISPRGSSSSAGPGPTFSPRKVLQQQQVSSQAVSTDGLSTDQRAALAKQRKEVILRKLGRL